MSPIPKEEIMFTLSMMGGSGNDSHRSIEALLKAGHLEEYAAKVVGGLVHQGAHQTGDDRPVGGTTATRIAHELLALMQHCGKDVSGFDFTKFHGLLDLDKYAS